MADAMTRTPSAARRAARDTALRVLYTLEVAHPPVEETLSETIAAHELDDGEATLARALVGAVRARTKSLDAAISHHATHYPAEKQTIVDRSILRLAMAELLFPVAETPAGVVANEAVELAKKYSTPEAARFVNGVLGSAIREKESEESHGAAVESGK